MLRVKARSKEAIAARVGFRGVLIYGVVIRASRLKGGNVLYRATTVLRYKEVS